MMRANCDEACSVPCSVFRAGISAWYDCEKTTGHFFESYFFNTKWKCETRCRTACVDMPYGYGIVGERYWCRETKPKEEYCLRFGQFVWATYAACMIFDD